MDTPLALQRATRLAVFVLATLALAKPTLSLAQVETLWTPKNIRVPITGPMRFNLGFVNQVGQPTSAIVSSLSPTQLNGMPSGLQAAAKSPLLNWTQSQGNYFDALWSSISSGVCTDVRNAVLKQVNQSPNTAYDPTPCAMGPRGVTMVTFQTSWAGPDLLTPGGKGRRLFIDYQVPLNAIAFYVTSPHTCKHGNNCPTEPQDPAFTLIFTVDLFVTCTSQAPAEVQTIPLPISCTSNSSITSDAVVGGDVTGQVAGAAIQWVHQLVAEAGSIVATAGADVIAAAVGAIAGAVNVAVKGIGAGIAAATDQHLRDFVSQALTILASYTAGSNAIHARTDFQNFFQDLYTAQLGGLRLFAVEIGPNDSLNFNLAYLPPAKPQLQNTTLTQNRGSIISPSIAIMQSQVVPGQAIQVKASNFRGTFINQLNMAWNQTVLGKPTSKLKWSPPDATITTPALTFQAIDLKPSTSYTFTVQECDGLTCSPWSEPLVTQTEAAAAGGVRFWLDSNATQIVGAQPLAAGGGDFIAVIKIPPTITPGQHILNAAAPGQPTATAPIDVCAAGGCGPSVALVNTADQSLYPNGWRVVTYSPVTLRGSLFTPGGIALIFLDKIAGNPLGKAPVGPLGHFQLTFNMPAAVQGSHNFIAVEGGNAGQVRILPMRPAGAPAPVQPPPGKVVQASVNVLVQAAAQ